MSFRQLNARVGQLLVFLVLCGVMAFTPVGQAKEKIILDVDVGIDDAMAILLATASPEIELIGVTTMFGNASIEDSTRNALYLLERTGMKVPVARGAAVPMVAEPIPRVAFVHGDNGLGNVAVPEPSHEMLSELSAVEFILQQSRLYPGEITLVPVGRLTNIALALLADSTLPERIKRVVLMGGAFETHGTITPVAGANTFGDPHAADIVFQASWDVTSIGTDVTRKVMLDEPDLDLLAQKNPVAGGFIRDFSTFYLDFHRKAGVTGGFFVHDPSAVMFVIKPELFTTKKAAIRVVREGLAAGQTIAAPSLKGQTDYWSANKFNAYADTVNSEKARAFMLERLIQVEFVE